MRFCLRKQGLRHIFSSRKPCSGVSVATSEIKIALAFRYEHQRHIEAPRPLAARQNWQTQMDVIKSANTLSKISLSMEELYRHDDTHLVIFCHMRYKLQM